MILDTVDTGFLIDSDTCENHALGIPLDVNDCKEKANLVGINDNHVLNANDKNKPCGCLAFLYGGKKHLHFNSPSGSCSKTMKCSSTTKCVCTGTSTQPI